MKNRLISIGGRMKVHPQQVVAIVEVANDSIAYMDDGKMLVVATTLKILAKRFQSLSFFRSYKSFLINLNYVSSFDSQSIDMKNDLEVMKMYFFKEMIKGFKL